MEVEEGKKIQVYNMDKVSRRMYRYEHCDYDWYSNIIMNI